MLLCYCYQSELLHDSFGAKVHFGETQRLLRTYISKAEVPISYTLPRWLQLSEASENELEKKRQVGGREERMRSTGAAAVVYTAFRPKSKANS